MSFWPTYSPASKTAGPFLASSMLGVLIAIGLRTVWPTNLDVSWLLILAERTLDGARPYRDFMEINPPASFLIYIPSVVLGRLTGITPEAVTNLLVFAGTALSLALSGTILIRAGVIDRSRALVLMCVGIGVLLILPLNSFGQREHIAVLALLPCLVALAVRARGEGLRWWEVILAGLGAAIALSIKPVFGLAFVGPGLLLVKMRSWQAVLKLPEAWLACGLAGLYGLAVLLFFPDFAERIVPLVARIYVPARLPLLGLLTSPIFMIWLGLVCTFLRAKPRIDSLGTVLILASVGFQMSFFIQGKGFVYHGFPAVALAALGCAQALLDAVANAPETRNSSRASVAIVATATLAGLLVFAGFHDNAQRNAALAHAIAPLSPRPRLLTITGDMSLGPVFVRDLGGDWVGSTSIAWITSYAHVLTLSADEDPRFADAIQMERDQYAGDIERQRPDAVLIDGEGWFRWTRHSAALVQALSRYSRVGLYGRLILWTRTLSAQTVEADAKPDTQTSEEPSLRRSLSPDSAL